MSWRKRRPSTDAARCAPSRRSCCLLLAQRSWSSSSFSLVWHWNDYYEPMMYLMKPQNFTVPLRLSILQQGLQELTGGQAGELFNEPLMMAACFLVVLPPLFLYMLTQRFFVESIERTGLVD